MEFFSIAGLPPDREGEMDCSMNISNLSPSLFPSDVYQRESLYNHYLPYANQLDRDSQEWLEEIKLNLSRAVLLREFRPGLVTWMSRLTGYISLYGYKFSKEEHVMFIQLAWKLLIIPDMEPRLLEVLVRVLLCLLKKRSLITPADIGEEKRSIIRFSNIYNLELSWKPLYDIYEDMSSHNATMCLKVYPQDFEKSLKLLIKLCRYYFSPSSTGEILREFRPYFCPHDVIMSKAMAYCTLFLPTLFVERLGILWSPFGFFTLFQGRRQRRLAEDREAVLHRVAGRVHHSLALLLQLSLLGGKPAVFDGETSGGQHWAD